MTDQHNSAGEPFRRGERSSHDRIRVAYLSADFCFHPVAILTAELFELHDRSKFEVSGVSFGRDDKSETRARLVRAFDQFHDVSETSAAEIAKLLQERRIDIAIDLMGFTKDARPGILARRPCPIQVSYLGYPATMGAGFIDYILADPVILPFDQQAFYSEKIVHLPFSYQPNDRKRQIGSRIWTRAEAGLPDHGFVFCCFNNNWKITPQIFDIWMRLLRTIEGSVLWLSNMNATAIANLKRETAARDVDPRRIVFAPFVDSNEEHLARHRLADLFVDTLPYNAHTTASDALWAGLPMVTCRGETFAARVAASLLHAIGLPELVTTNLADYEALILRLARDPTMLAATKDKLVRQRDTHPLFDSQRHTRHIEAAYTAMWEIWRGGEAPRSFAVPS